MYLFDYTIKRSPRRKRAAVVVDFDGKVEIRVPTFVSDTEIEKIVRSKNEWVEEKLRELEQSPYRLPPHQYLEGERFLFMGRLCPLELSVGRGTASLRNNILSVRVPPGVTGNERKEYIKRLVHNFFREESHTILKQKTQTLGTRNNLQAIHVSTKDYSSRWGCCFADGRIFFNWKIIFAPEHIMDYVIAHELCHLRIRNHSSLFWRSVEKIIPDYRTRRTWLRRHGHTLTV